MNAPLMDPAAVLRRAERLPRYTSYPTANHFTPAVTAEDYAAWLALLPRSGSISK